MKIVGKGVTQQDHGTMGVEITFTDHRIRLAERVVVHFTIETDMRGVCTGRGRLLFQYSGQGVKLLLLSRNLALLPSQFCAQAFESRNIGSLR
jgi:hypothetical protein